jgi:hypothetical protein
MFHKYIDKIFYHLDISMSRKVAYLAAFAH